MPPDSPILACDSMGKPGGLRSAVAWGVMNLAVGFTPGTSVASPMVVLVSLMALRFLMGAVQGPLNPVAGGGTIASWFPVTGWAVPNGLFNVGLTFGAAATGPLIAWLVSEVGWRWSFIATAPLGPILAAIWWWYVRDTPAEHASVQSLGLACQQLTEGAYWAATISVAEQDASTACGVLNTGGNVVGGIGALMVPLMVESLGWPAAFAGTSVVALVGAGLWLLIDAEAGNA